MTIAVSVYVRPSRILARMVVFFICLNNVVLWSVFYSFGLGKLLFLILAFICATGSVFLILQFFHRQKIVNLDISDSGELILRIFQSELSIFEPQKVTLTKSSTLWQKILFLHLRAEDGTPYLLVILRDSVDRDAFRTLLVVTRWLLIRAPNENVHDENVLPGNF